MRTLWLAWRCHDPNITTLSCVLIGWLLLTQFAAAPANTLVVTLLPAALAPLQALTAILTVELVVDLPPGGGHRGYAAVVDGSGLVVACRCSHSMGGR